MRPQATTPAETTRRLIALGACPNHPTRRAMDGKQECFECFARSKSDPYDEAHGHDHNEMED